MDRRAFLRNSLLGVAAGSLGKNGLISIARAADGQITPLGQRPRVVVISDIKAGSGDPDDRQSMAHLMMYANEVDIRGIWPDDMSSGGTATRIAIDNYEKDYNNSSYNFKKLDYPTPAQVRTKLFTSHNQAISAIKTEAGRADSRPIYMLVWGGTHRVPQSLERLTAQERSKIRLISIGTYLLDNALASGDGRRYNWNAWGEARNNIWKRFPDVWWLEMDWTWMGMVFNENLRVSNEAIVLNDRLARDAGALGAHIKAVFPRYFRALDTNSLLYVLDPANNLNDPTKGSWAGRYVRPFSERPNYYIGIDGGHNWNYGNPASTWSNARSVFNSRIRTTISQRNAWHQAFIQKVQQLYGHEPISDRPTVTAGADTSIQLPADSITLTGSIGSLGCAVATYQWSQVSGPANVALNGATSPQLRVNNLTVAGTYVFRLTVTDVCGARATDDVQVTVLPPNNGPVANAGPDQTLNDSDGDGEARVVLNGTGSVDGTGTIVSYVWKEGSRVLATADTGSVAIDLPVGVHTLTLTVTDDKRMTASDSVKITVNGESPSPNEDDGGGESPPSSNTGLYRAINLNGAAVTVDGVSFEGKNAGNYSTVGRTHVSRTAPQSVVNNGQRSMLQSFIWGRPVSVTMTSIPTGVYQVYLWVFEDNNSVTYSVKLNSRVVLMNQRSGSAGSWKRLDLGTTTITNGRLAVQGDLSRDALNMCAIEVWREGGSAPANQGPTADAGANQTVTDSDGDGTERVTLNGSNSSDRDGRIASYRWQEGSATLATTATAAVNLSVGVHTLTLTVTDDNGSTDNDTVTITVNQRPAAPEPEEPPSPEPEEPPSPEEPEPNQPSPPEGDTPLTGTLYRAINLNGSATVVDGVSFEGQNAANYSTVGRTHVSRTVPKPAVDRAKQSMLQRFIWNRSARVTMTSIPRGSYQVYLWVFEDNHSVNFSVKVNGRTALANQRSGVAGSWKRLDLGTANISNGQLVVQGELSRDALNMCAIEVWRE
ncbi:PKD domain-containing protein [Leptothoe kymatousa]|uniref:DUF1593 domain-containing protein n=1 Tax=Leptothoe kymatousa TAU-MAC 1615 TaxID=2364775 RepID=A0ABS5XYN9_9CYAN|nr:nucleoside hydrolase-like domain-containing protein [Leptothoe kymatousa]MBT9310743.1 DUF1593 domain-containing protein [Leptothoe kymatousa TAU-MAC 1615]